MKLLLCKINLLDIFHIIDSDFYLIETRLFNFV